MISVNWPRVLELMKSLGPLGPKLQVLSKYVLVATVSFLAGFIGLMYKSASSADGTLSTAKLVFCLGGLF